MGDIRIGTSEKGGTFWSQAMAMALLLEQKYGITSEVLDSQKASIENAQKLDLAEIDFGFIASNWIGRAYRGESPFSNSVNLRVAAPANAGAMFFITKANSGIKYIRDLVGKKVSIGPKGSGMVQHIKTIFQVLDISFDNFQPYYFNFEKGGYALEAGEVDAQWQCPFPNQVMKNISKRMEVRVLEYDPNDLEKILNEVSFYRPSILAANLFEGLDRNSRQLGVVNLIAVHSRTNEEVVRKFVTMMLSYLKELEELNPLFKNLTELLDVIKENGMSAIEYGDTPVHSGAIQAYRDHGYL